MAENEGYSRFLASAPPDQREIRTFEIYHPAMTQLFRFAQGYVQESLPLEDDAPRNPGEVVDFKAIAAQITEPAESSRGEPILTIALGAVGSEVNEQVSLIKGEDTQTPVQLIYRKYYTGDLSAPVLVYRLSLSSISFESYTQINFTAEDYDFSNKTSGEIYTLERFPGLIGA
jgi:hypothetical protein